MNNLKKFTSEADYSAATLSYPAVSWVTATDNVHFDKSAPAPVNDKVMIASYNGITYGQHERFIFYNCESYTSEDITAITLDDVAVEPITCQTEPVYDASQVHIAKYDLSATTVGDWCAGNLGCIYGSAYADVEILIPSQITVVDNMPTNITKLVVEATTPPTTSMGTSGYERLQGIYVPDDSVSTYKTAWYNFSDIIYPISEYQGNLPV